MAETQTQLPPGVTPLPSGVTAKTVVSSTPLPSGVTPLPPGVKPISKSVTPPIQQPVVVQKKAPPIFVDLPDNAIAQKSVSLPKVSQNAHDALSQIPFKFNISGAARTPEVNKSVGGVQDSAHLSGDAVDIKADSDGLNVYDWYNSPEGKKWQKNNNAEVYLEKGNKMVSVYDLADHIHIEFNGAGQPKTTPLPSNVSKGKSPNVSQGTLPNLTGKYQVGVTDSQTPIEGRISKTPITTDVNPLQVPGTMGKVLINSASKLGGSAFDFVADAVVEPILDITGNHDMVAGYNQWKEDKNKTPLQLTPQEQKDTEGITPLSTLYNISGMIPTVTALALTGGTLAIAGEAAGMTNAAASMFGTVAGGFPYFYEENLKEAKNAMPDASVVQQNLYATTSTTLMGLVFHFLPALQQVKGAGNEVAQIGAKQFAKSLSEGALEKTASQKAAAAMLEGIKNIATNSGVMTANEVTNGLLKASNNYLSGSKFQYDLSPKTIATNFVANVLMNIPFGGLAMVSKLKSDNYLEASTAIFAAKNPNEVLSELESMKQSGKITEAQFNNAVSNVDEVSNIWNKMPVDYTDSQKTRIAPLLQQYDEAQGAIKKLESQKEVLHPTLHDSQDAAIKELTDHQNKIKEQIDAIKNEKPEVPGELTLFHGSKKDGKSEVAEVSKTFTNVLTIDNTVEGWLQERADGGDKKAQEILDSGNKYMESQPYIQELFGSNDAVQFTNKGKNKKGDFPAEYFDTKEGRFYSTTEQHARVGYSTNDRSGKYKDKGVTLDGSNKSESIELTPTKTEDVSAQPSEEVKPTLTEAQQQIKDLNDDETYTAYVSDINEVPESLRDRVVKVGGDIKTRKSFLGIPYGKETTHNSYRYSFTGKEAKDAILPKTKTPSQEGDIVELSGDRTAIFKDGEWVSAKSGVKAGFNTLKEIQEKLSKPPEQKVEAPIPDVPLVEKNKKTNTINGYEFTKTPSLENVQVNKLTDGEAKSIKEQLYTSKGRNILNDGVKYEGGGWYSIDAVDNYGGQVMFNDITNEAVMLNHKQGGRAGIVMLDFLKNNSRYNDYIAIRGSKYSQEEHNPKFGGSGHYKGTYFYIGLGAESKALEHGKNLSKVDISYAKLYELGENGVTSQTLKNEAKKAGYDTRDASGYAESEYLKKQGYDGIQRGNEVILFEPKKFETNESPKTTKEQGTNSEKGQGTNNGTLQGNDTADMSRKQKEILSKPSISEQLKQHLQSITKEEFQKEWNEIEKMGFEGVDAVKYAEYLKETEPKPTSQKSDVPLEGEKKSWGDQAVEWYDKKHDGAKSVEDANNSGFFNGADKKVVKLAGDAAQKMWEATKDISKAVEAFIKEIKKGYPVEYKYNKELFKAEVKKHVEKNILNTIPEKKVNVKKEAEKTTGVKKEKKIIKVDEKKALKNKFSEIVKAQREESKKSTLGGMMAQGREMAKKIRKIEEGNAKNKEALINKLKKEHQKNTQKIIDAVKRIKEGKEFQKKVADLIHSPVWKDKLNARQVTALLDKASRVNSERSLKAFDDYARKVIGDANYATYLDKAKSEAKKARKILRDKNIPEYNRNIVARILELNPEKVTDLTIYTKILSSLQKELTGNKTGRDFTANEIEEFVSKQHDEIKKAEDAELQVELDELLMKGVVDGSLSIDGKPTENTDGWTMKKFRENMNEIAKKWTIEDYKEMLGDLEKAEKEGKITPEMKETMISKLRDEVPMLKAQMESQRIINKETNPETPEERNALNIINRIDPNTADAKTLAAFNNVVNNYIESGNLSGVGKDLIANQLAKERLDAADARMIKVKQLRKGDVYKKSLTNIFKDLTYTKQNASRIATLTTHIIKLAQSKAHRVRNEVFEKILDIAKNNRFDNKNNTRLSMFAFLNQEFSKKDGSTATFEDLIQHLEKSADNLIEEGRKKDKAENSSVINKVFKKSGVGKDYIDWGNEIKDILETDFKGVKSAEEARSRLSHYEKKIYDMAAKFFSDRAAKTQEVARLVENKSMPLTNNYFPLERLFKKGESLSDKGVYTGDRDVELYNNDFNGDFIDKSTIGSTISRKPLDENTIYNPQFLQVFAKKAFEQEFYNNGQQELYTLSSILNSEDFKKIVNEAWNPKESLTNHVMMKEKIVDVVDDWKNSGSLPNTANNLVEYLVKKSVSTVLNSVGQIPKQYIPNIRQSMQANGIGATVKAMSLRGGETGKARDMLLNAMSVKEAGGRGDILLEDSIYKEYFAGLKNKSIADVRSFFDNAPVLSQVLKLGANSFKLGDQAGRNDVYISSYIKSLIDQGKIKKASEFDIFKEAENPNEEALSYAETTSPAIVNSSTSQERASILKDSNKSFTGKLSWTLMGYSLNSYQQAKSALRIVFDSRSTKSERWAAANDYYGFYSQLVAFGAMSFAYSLTKNYVSQGLAGLFGYETTDDEAKKERDKSVMRTGVKVVTDLALSGQNIIGQNAGQAGVNWLYGQINQAVTEHPSANINKGTIRDATFKPFYQDGANIGIADLPVNLANDIYEEAKSLMSSKDDKKEVPHDIQLSLLAAKIMAFVIENGDMYNVAGKTQSIIKKKQNTKPVNNQLLY